MQGLKMISSARQENEEIEIENSGLSVPGVSPAIPHKKNGFDSGCFSSYIPFPFSLQTTTFMYLQWA
jgi:hypothetical protein